MSTDLSYLSSAFGYLGVVANLIWPLMHSRTKLLAGQVVACVLMCVHFALLSAHTGALIMLVAGIQAALAIPVGKSPYFKLIYLGSLSMTPVVCVISWQGQQSIFSSLALAIVCIANFQLNHLYQRACLITAIFAWVAHNIIVESIPGLISNLIAFCISLVMLVRVYWMARVVTT